MWQPPRTSIPRQAASSYFTLTFTFALLPLAVATVIVTVPFFTPFTTPLALTVAMPGSELGQVQLPVVSTKIPSATEPLDYAVFP